MAGQNRRPEAEARDGSSSEDEEESSEENEEQEESETESEGDKASAPPPKKPSAHKKPESTQPQASSSDDNSGTESDSEPDTQPNASRRSASEIKPIASKPMEQPPKATKKPRSKPSAKAPPTPVAKPTASTKRPVDSGNIREEKDSKRAKKKALDADEVVEEENVKKTGDDAKKQLFQRLWSEEDEIAILKGMIEYAAKKGAEPTADMTAFYDFIRKSLHIEASKSQLSEKVRRLKKKYETNAKKSKNGEDRTFSKAHEQTAYQLSKKIWGRSEANGSVGADVSKFSVKGKRAEAQSQRAGMALPELDSGRSTLDGAKDRKKMEVEEALISSPPVGLLSRFVGESSLEEEIIKDGLELITGPKKLDLQEKWKQLRVEEVELYLKRVELIREQTALVLEALKSPGH